MHQIMALVGFFLTNVVYCKLASEENNDNSESKLGYGTIALRTVTIVVGIALLITLTCVFGCVWCVFHDIKQRQFESLQLSSNQSAFSGVTGVQKSQYTLVEPIATTTKAKVDKVQKIPSKDEIQRRANVIAVSEKKASDGISIAISPKKDGYNQIEQSNQVNPQTLINNANDTASVASAFSEYRPATG